MNRCPLCAGTGELAADTAESIVSEISDVHSTTAKFDPPWQADLRRLLKLLHQAVIDHDTERVQRKTTS